ncbi:hypothetical protein SY89_02165 [Halolamina pelagica]|uniref:Uncharacterized protein n=1 Tax=Halolamina pelagica TaxID=699431 RepID=A0A0N8I062_9EURY|nr:hypothetical protein SY89_02165 [Halolamina pelagica]
MVDDLDPERVAAALLPDLVDSLAAFASLRRDDQDVELGLGRDPGRFVQSADLELAAVLLGQRLQFRFEISFAILPGANVSLDVTGLRGELVGRETDGQIAEFERAAEQLAVTVVDGVERPPMATCIPRLPRAGG